MIIVGATIAPWKCDGEELNWLYKAELMQSSTEHQVLFFVSLEVDARGLEPYELLLERLAELGGEHWQFLYDDTEDEWNGGNRLARICAGRNMIIERAMRTLKDEDPVTHILFLDTDLMVPGLALRKLLEMDYPIVGGDVPSYGLNGPEAMRFVGRNHDGREVFEPYPFPVQAHMNTAGFLMVQRSVFSKIRWRCDWDAGLSDDPCYHADARDHLGLETLVRKDLRAIHPILVPVEQRHEADKKIRRLW